MSACGPSLGYSGPTHTLIHSESGLTITLPESYYICAYPSAGMIAMTAIRMDRTFDSSACLADIGMYSAPGLDRLPTAPSAFYRYPPKLINFGIVDDNPLAGETVRRIRYHGKTAKYTIDIDSDNGASGDPVHSLHACRAIESEKYLCVSSTEYSELGAVFDTELAALLTAEIRQMP